MGVTYYSWPVLVSAFKHTASLGGKLGVLKLMGGSLIGGTTPLGGVTFPSLFGLSVYSHLSLYTTAFGVGFAIGTVIKGSYLKSLTSFPMPKPYMPGPFPSPSSAATGGKFKVYKDGTPFYHEWGGPIGEVQKKYIAYSPKGRKFFTSLSKDLVLDPAETGWYHSLRRDYILRYGGRLEFDINNYDFDIQLRLSSKTSIVSEETWARIRGLDAHAWAQIGEFVDGSGILVPTVTRIGVERDRKDNRGWVRLVIGAAGSVYYGAQGLEEGGNDYYVGSFPYSARFDKKHWTPTFNYKMDVGVPLYKPAPPPWERSHPKFTYWQSFETGVRGKVKPGRFESIYQGPTIQGKLNKLSSWEWIYPGAIAWSRTAFDFSWYGSTSLESTSIDALISNMQEYYKDIYVEMYRIVQPETELLDFKKKKKDKKKMPCCTISQCSHIIKRLKEMEKSLTKYLYYDLKGAFLPICLEEGTQNPLTKEPIVDWSDPKKLEAAIDVIAKGGALSGTKKVPEIYAGPGVKGLSQMVTSLSHQLAKTALATDRAKALWCAIEEPELETVVLASDITEDRLVGLPNTTIYVIVNVDYVPGAIRNAWPSMTPGVPEKVWAGHVLFRDAEGTYSPEYQVSGKKTRFWLPFPSTHILVRPVVGARYQISVKRPVVT